MASIGWEKSGLVKLTTHARKSVQSMSLAVWLVNTILGLGQDLSVVLYTYEVTGHGEQTYVRRAD